MRGTDKQIATANVIINEMITELNRHRTAPQPEIGTDNVPWFISAYGIRRDQHDNFITWLRSLDDAHQIIDWFGRRTRACRVFRVSQAWRAWLKSQN